LISIDSTASVRAGKVAVAMLAEDEEVMALLLVVNVHHGRHEKKPRAEQYKHCPRYTLPFSYLAGCRNQ